MPKRTTRITIETERTLIVRRANPVRAWCKRCSAEVDTVVLDAAGVLAQLDRTTIQGWREGEELHATRKPDGSARICLESLLRSARRVFRLAPPRLDGVDEEPRKVNDRTHHPETGRSRP